MCWKGIGDGDGGGKRVQRVLGVCHSEMMIRCWCCWCYRNVQVFESGTVVLGVDA